MFAEMVKMMLCAIVPRNNEVISSWYSLGVYLIDTTR